MSSIDRITGTALPLRGDSIDTDRIMPARFLRAITFSGLEAHLFEDDRREVDARAASGEGKLHAFSDPAFANATILIVGANFGCGSSREHAPQALYRRGLRAIVGESYSEIFFSNSVALGMPCVRASRDVVEKLMTATEAEPSTAVDVSLSDMRLTMGAERHAISLPPGTRESFLTGHWDATGLLLREPDVIARVAERLPYVTGF
jgi:3-isopropylmalate/(R)-2-methylmalate dehydratase small subunit